MKPKGFDRTHRCKSDDEVQRVQQGSLKYLIREVDGENGVAEEEDDEKTPGETTVYTMTHYIGLELRQGMFAPDLAIAPARLKRFMCPFIRF